MQEILKKQAIQSYQLSDDPLSTPEHSPLFLSEITFKDHFFETNSAKKIIESIHSAIHEHKGVFLLSGESGVGKTTLLLHLEFKLKSQDIITARITDSILNEKELLEKIAKGFGLKHRPGLTPSHLLIVLRTFLLHQFKQGRKCVILVDEAHDMGWTALDTIRMLTDMKSEGIKLVQIILCGRPALLERLQMKRLRKLLEKITLNASMARFTKSETAEYATFMLAKSKSRVSLSPTELDALWAISKGNPNMINRLLQGNGAMTQQQHATQGQNQQDLFQKLNESSSQSSRRTNPMQKDLKNWWGDFFGVKGMSGFAGLGLVVVFALATVLVWIASLT
ncbi:AAA domain-containing protein [Desulfonatronum thiosulfatophilum]|uniref:AAA domain-containing protein n=1 Tax=Desulfonatronum thiosulfatophilum TaxID=617002 RepID=A0A1G6CTS7_9BACT|nr:ATP-binding protein [Desulfonatronum thiosulfatophilum]SDB36293.1 AAA domain-containing protein [Desulfonatronum thiosulfatophilum]